MKSEPDVYSIDMLASAPKKTDVWLRSKGIIGDYRGEIFRIGFAPYHTDKDIQEFFDRLILH